jgi:hypothetical protein
MFNDLFQSKLLDANHNCDNRQDRRSTASAMAIDGHAPPSIDSPPPSKRSKPSSNFHQSLFHNVSSLSSSYASSTPYKHSVVDQIFDLDFLTKARKEIVEQINFREKETDIYKVSLVARALSLGHR